VTVEADSEQGDYAGEAGDSSATRQEQGGRPEAELGLDKWPRVYMHRDL
jgi:hypothetical protein